MNNTSKPTLRTRREFLKSAVLGCGACVAFSILPRRVSATADGAFECTFCRAMLLRTSSFRHNGVDRAYCPNCGINVLLGAPDVHNALAHYCEPKRPRRLASPMRWDSARVPFPNPELVKLTGKPAVVFSDCKIEFGGRRAI